MPSKCASASCSKKASIQATMPGATTYSYFCSTAHATIEGAVQTHNKKRRVSNTHKKQTSGANSGEIVPPKVVLNRFLIRCKGNMLAISFQVDEFANSSPRSRPKRCWNRRLEFHEGLYESVVCWEVHLASPMSSAGESAFHFVSK